VSVCLWETATSWTGVDLTLQALKQSANMADDARRHGNEQSVSAPTTTADSSVKRVRILNYRLVLRFILPQLLLLFCSYQS